MKTTTTFTKTTRVLALAGVLAFGATACQTPEDTGEQPGQEQADGGIGAGAGGDEGEGAEEGGSGFGPVGEPNIADKFKDATFEVPGEPGEESSGYQVDLSTGNPCTDTDEGTYCLAVAVEHAQSDDGVMTLWHRIVKEGEAELKTMSESGPDDNGDFPSGGAAWVEAGDTAKCDSYNIMDVGLAARNEEAEGCTTIAWRLTNDEDGNSVWMPVTK